jgi:HK97 family phage major capsid protein/HK97 family phage prohead protease
MTKINRAYSFLDIKEMNEGEEERVIRGIATTPNPDRVGDIVEPLGVEFKNPLPLLFHHDSRLPIGLVTFEKPTKKGIAFEARLPRVSEAGTLKDRIDEAWQSIKLGLIRAVSIGFRTLEYEVIKETGGIKFTKSEVMELSAVVIPANSDAIISSVKSFDIGLETDKSIESIEKNNSEASKVLAIQAKTIANTPGVSGKAVKLIKTIGPSAKKENVNMKKSYTDQIADFQATLNVKSARLEEIMSESAEKGETLDSDQELEYETLTDEIKSLEKHIGRLNGLAAISRDSAKPVVNVDTAKAGSELRAGVQVKNEPKLEKGIEFARFAMAIAAGKGNLMQSAEIAKSKFGENNAITTSIKAAVGAGSTTNPTWAAPLVDTYQRFAGDFVEYLRPQTIIGKFGNGGVPSLRRIPFNVSIPTQTSGGEGYWVGQGQAKPLTKFDFGEITLGFAKVANIAVITEELLRFSDPAAEGIVRDQLAAALVARLDIDFVNPAKTAVTNVSPASITNGGTAIASGGTDADAVRADIKALMATYLAANVSPTTGVWIMPSMVALSLSLVLNPLGQPEFPGVTMTGGTFFGMPVIVSDYVPSGVVILANASDIYLADDGQVSVDVSNQASLQMDNAPTNVSGSLGTTNPSVPVATSLVSLWQTNSVGIRAERFINWGKRRASAVAYLTGVAWGGEPTT